MALILKDRVLETSQTSGTGTIALSGAVNGFQTFSSAIGNTNTTYYAIVDDADSQWEVGLGTVGAGTLTRDTVYSSSNGGSKVNFGTSIKNVFCDYPASKSVNLDANDKVSFGGNTYEDFTSTTAPSYSEGRVWYDSTEKALAFYNDSSSLAVHVSQDLIFKVINNTGSTIPNGSPVYITSTSTGQSYPNVALAKADVAATSAVIGLTNGAIANGATGYVSSQGTIDNVNTSTFTVGQVLYLSPYSAGQLMNTIPPTGITVQVGVATYIDSSAGHIYVKQTTPLAVPASIITGQVAVANGGTGASTASGARTNLGLGTIATQDASAVAITGGTINGTTVGATTPAAGTFTTITGQTEVLKGTGQNFLTQSQTFSTWGVGTITLTANITTAPDSTSTAASILSNSTSTNNYITKSASSTLTNTAYTFSVYAKKLDSNFINLTVYDGTNGSRYWFNISTGVLGSTAAVGSGFTNLSGTITSASNGWYRCTLTATTLSVNSIQTFLAFTDADASLTQTTAKTNYLWGAQLEIGSTANTYTATTSAAIYGTPTLSFSGVSTLGLESNGALFLQPAGTGALQAQATTSTTVGGNVRGANAVDWQTIRNAAGQVASASFSVVSGGSTNTASNTVSTVSGGFTNTASAYASVVSGGQSNTASGQYSVISGGASNTSAGFYNVINGGFTNSGTSGSAVTTQSGTMNGTTAVTLSGSNANIKVGQYITGTSIAGDTYVAAISGTSLTLSKNASGSSTSTLSFFTPHGVVVGGGNNQATGSYSFIGGGGDAGTAANRNVASGDWSTVGGGQANQATGLYSVVAGGLTNTATNTRSAVLSGRSCNATGSEAVILGGSFTAASGGSSLAFGYNCTTRGITGLFSYSGANAGVSQGNVQIGTLVLYRQTTDATATVLCSDNNTASGTNQVILPNNSVYYFKGEVISGVTAGGDSKGWEISGVIKRGANAASTTLVGSTVTSLYADAGAATWALAVTADTTNGGLKVTFTGQAATTIRTVCQIRTTEMTY